MPSSFIANTGLSLQTKQRTGAGNSLVVQGQGLDSFTAEGAGSSPDGGTKIPQAT